MNKQDQDFLVQKIRTQYTEKEHGALDELKQLDRKVKRPANIFAYVFGSFAALVMGAGMSLVMTDMAQTLAIADPMVWGILLGVAGMAMAIVNYPIFKAILRRRRKAYAGRIIALSDRLTKG